MTYLLDTHAFLWAAMMTRHLSPRVRRIIEDRTISVGVSVVSFWEIALKHSLGKLPLVGTAPEELPATAHYLGLGVVPLHPEDAASIHRLARTTHKDPFDRMLVWQCLRQAMALISADRSLHSYREFGLELVW